MLAWSLALRGLFPGPSLCYKGQLGEGAPLRQRLVSKGGVQWSSPVCNFTLFDEIDPSRDASSMARSAATQSTCRMPAARPTVRRNFLSTPCSSVHMCAPMLARNPLMHGVWRVLNSIGGSEAKNTQPTISWSAPACYWSALCKSVRHRSTNMGPHRYGDGVRKLSNTVGGRQKLSTYPKYPGSLMLRTKAASPRSCSRYSSESSRYRASCGHSALLLSSLASLS